MRYLRYFFEIAYDGTAYSGWQRQPNAMTVQERIEQALSKLSGGEHIGIMGCGRTDAGVHSSKFYFHTDLKAEMQIDNLKFKLNHMLPFDISIKSIIKVGETAHARFDATSRSYTYHLHTQKNPFISKYSTYYSQARKVDFSLLETTAAMLMQYEDFATFCKIQTDVKTTLCDLRESRWARGADGYSYAYHVSANRFLRGMVRLIVGASVQVATGVLGIQELEESIQKKTKPHLLFSAPPQGLVLHTVTYPYALQPL